MIDAALLDKRTKTYQKITSKGVTVVGPLDFSQFMTAEASVDNVAVELFEPKPNNSVIITAIVLYANKNVGAGDATVELFHGSSSDVNSGINILKQEMLKQTTLVLTGLEILVSAGRWIKVVTDDNSVFANVAGYYVNDN